MKIPWNEFLIKVQSFPLLDHSFFCWLYNRKFRIYFWRSLDVCPRNMVFCLKRWKFLRTQIKFKQSLCFSLKLSIKNCEENFSFVKSVKKTFRIQVCRHCYVENFRQKIRNLTWVGTPTSYRFLSERPGFWQMISFYVKSYAKFFSAELSYLNNNKLCTKIKIHSC